MAGDNRSWADRDAAVVWHGFTQMQGPRSPLAADADSADLAAALEPTLVVLVADAGLGATTPCCCASRCCPPRLSWC